MAVGVACHELGHAVGTWIPGNRVLEFVPFRPGSEEYPNYVGWVRHTLGKGVWGKVSRMIICTGPIWFGSILILLLTRFLVGQESGKDTIHAGKLLKVLATLGMDFSLTAPKGI